MTPDDSQANAESVKNRHGECCIESAINAKTIAQERNASEGKTNNWKQQAQAAVDFIMSSLEVK